MKIITYDGPKPTSVEELLLYSADRIESVGLNQDGQYFDLETGSGCITATLIIVELGRFEFVEYDELSRSEQENLGGKSGYYDSCVWDVIPPIILMNLSYQAYCAIERYVLARYRMLVSYWSIKTPKDEVVSVLREIANSQELNGDCNA